MVGRAGYSCVFLLTLRMNKILYELAWAVKVGFSQAVKVVLQEHERRVCMSSEGGVFASSEGSFARA